MRSTTLAGHATALFVACVTTFVLACSDTPNDVQNPAADASTSTTDASTSPAPDAATDAGADATDASETSNLPRPTLPGLGAIPVTLGEPLDTSKTYRFAIVWFQFNDDGPDPAPEIGYEAAFDPSQTTVQVPTLLGPSAQTIVCERDGTDESATPCRADSPYALGTAALVIAEDVNGNGKVDIGPEEIRLRGHGMVIYSAKGGDDLPEEDGQQTLIDGPISAGATVYESYEPAEGNDRLRLRTAPIVFLTQGPNLS